MRRKRCVLVAVALCLFQANGAVAQSFTCSFGKRAACLDYGDTVCSSWGKCVDENAACFEQYQCDYEGFTCKSYLSDCGDKLSEFADDYDSLVWDYNKLRGVAEELAEQIDDVKFCISLAENLSEAKECQFR